MNHSPRSPNIWRVTGFAGIACVVLSWAQFPLWMVGSPPSVYDGAAFARHLLSIRGVVFTRVLMDLGIYASMMVFAVGFRQLVKQARESAEWLGTLTFGAAIVWLSVTLVADGLEAGAALDAVSGAPDPSAVRALVLGTMLIYNGSTAFAVTAMFLASAGYATFASDVLPRWTGWAAYLSAALCVACVPAVYFGPVDTSGFYNAGGWGAAIIANFPPLAWFLCVGIVMLRRANAGADDSQPASPPRRIGIRTRSE
jgi:hypothetical protein